MTLVHIARTWHGLPTYVHVKCMQFSYLFWRDFKITEDTVTCLGCIAAEATVGKSFEAYVVRKS
jgi:hypothetical protein